MIYLSPYNPQWPNLFLVEREVLQKSIGRHIVAIEHIGSTAIPNIYAKPILDIMIGVDYLNDVNSEVITAIENLGYQYVKTYEDKMPFRRFFQKDNSEGNRTHQIHLVEVTHEFWRRHLLFRDYLRTHQKDAKAYEQLKLELAEKFSDTNQYAGAKTAFCDAIYSKAKKWEKDKF